MSKGLDEKKKNLFTTLLIRYGEIGLKSTKVRRRLENILINRIKKMLERKNISYTSLKLLPTRGRIYLYTQDLFSSAQELKKCFGIVSFSPAFQVSSERELIREAALKLAETSLKMNDSFAIRTKRSGQHPFTSQEISADIGAFILKNLADRGISVDLTKPDQTIYIEIRDKNTYLFNKIIYGAGGLPYGSQGNLISLLSGGIDSPIATWLMMKRGCNIIPLFCDLTPFTDDSVKNRVKQVVRNLFEYSPFKQITLYCTPHGIILRKIKEFIPPKFTCIFCKRLMYKIAEKLAKRFNAKGVVTGENLGQVASQTLENLFVLNQSIKIPVFRPLIGLDKTEIIDLSRKIGLYQSSIMPATSCTAVPQYPETHGNLEKIIEIEVENKFQELVNEAFKAIREIKISIL